MRPDLIPRTYVYIAMTLDTAPHNPNSFTVSVLVLKRWVNRNLSQCPLLRDVILDEPDVMDPDEFLTKSKLWLALFEKEWYRSQVMRFP